MKKRTIAVLLTMAMAATMMAGCGSKSDSKTADGEKSYTIGISQIFRGTERGRYRGRKESEC